MLVLLVLLQIKEKPLSTHALLRPLIIVGVVVVATYFTTPPTAGNDLVLIAALGLFGLLIGTAGGQATILRRRAEDGAVTSQITPQPRRADQPHEPHLAPIRQRIESIFWTFKDILTLERHGARTLRNLRVRLCARFAALAARSCSTTSWAAPAARSSPTRHNPVALLI